jgi:hypothetical protein
VIDPRRAGNLITWLVPRRESEALLAQARSAIDPIVALDRKSITVHPSASSREVFLRYRGLVFARWDDGACFLWKPGSAEGVDAEHARGVREIIGTASNLSPPAGQRHAAHALSRAAGALAGIHSARHVTRVDAVLDNRFVYTQVFAGVGGEHGIIDVLTITRSGRLAILELKASEHIHLPVQAADYWLRVRRHLELGEFGTYGYFPGIEIQQAPPLVYLVAPALRFHPMTGVLLGCLERQIEVVRVGLTESWRRGIRVITRQ